MKTVLALFCLLFAAPGDPIMVDFSVLSGFEWTEGMELPEKVKELDGKTIGIGGFIRTTDGRETGITEFWLVDQACDCEGWPKMNEVIYCTLPEGKHIDNDDSPVKVIGKFTCGEESDGDYVVSIYRLQVSTVE